MPVLLALYLLNLSNRPAGGRSAWTSAGRASTSASALLIALGIGIPGLGLYLVARELG